MNAFEETNIPILSDIRLRECNYGSMNRMDSAKIMAEKIKRIKTPFPNGESYEECARRMGDFLDYLSKQHNDGDKVLIVGHRATQYGLEHHILGTTLEECITAKWKWQSGWEYIFKID